MELFIIILLVIFVIMVLTLKPDRMILMNKPQTQMVQCYKEEQSNLVMLPDPNPVSLTMH
jgi:hypothetical protein